MKWLCKNGKQIKISFKSKMGIFIILALVGTAFGIFIYTQGFISSEVPIIAEQPIEKLTITAIPLREGAETITLFSNTDQPKGLSTSLEEGVKYELILESNFEIPSELIIYYNIENIEITQNQEITLTENRMCIALNGEKRIQAELIGSGSASFFDGLTIENERGCTAYALCSEFITTDLMKTEKTNVDIILLDDIESEDNFYITMPCNLILNNNTLTIHGDFVFETDSTGKLMIDNAFSSQITVDRFFVEARNCDIEVKNDFVDYQNAIGFFINAKTYNNTAMEANCRIIKNEEMLVQLLDDKQYPRLFVDTKIVFNEDIVLQNNNLLISVPVSFEVNATVIASTPILVKTWETGTVKIDVLENGNAENVFIIEAPECALLWIGKNSPSIIEVSEQMNVKTYNNQEMLSYGLGGNGKGVILSFSLNKQLNIEANEDMKWSVDGNVISLAVSYLVSEHCLMNAVLDVEAENGSVSFNTECINEDNSINLLKSCTCTITDSLGNQRNYSVRTERVIYNLPVVNLTVDDNTEITSKDVYKTATISIDSSSTQQFPSLSKTIVNIKGRGNSTWKWDKKPYKLKFNSDTSVLGKTDAKEWVLLANYSDKTLIRSYIAMEMGAVLDNMDFSPTQYPVDLFVNGTYRGVYTLGEQIEVEKGRIEIDKDYEEVDTGYLIEVGGAETTIDVLDKEYFNAGTLWRISVKSPNPSKMTQESFDYIKNYVMEADAAVVSLTNYEEYIDVDSLIDWFILQELSYNLDSGFRRSCFMTKEKGGKLKMGPIWDFDLAFGNFSKDNVKYDDWATVGEEGGYAWITWMNYLMEDETFRDKLQARWDEIKTDLLETAITKIDEMAVIIEPSQQMNFAVWQIWDIRAGYSPRSLVSCNTYEKQIQYMKDFLYKRYQWMDEHI